MSSKLKKHQWDEIGDFLNHWFYKPDLDALAISLAAYISHLDLSIEPVWLFVIGPSSTGKTHIICNALNCLPSVREISDITPSSFVSGMKKKSGGYSLLFDLPKIGKDPNKTQATLVFPDFSSVMGMRFEDRAALMKHLRQIYDGRFNPLKGVALAQREWAGKISVIAAVTNSVERAWAVQRDLGERFIQVRWARGDGESMALSAIAQLENPDIISKFQTMVKSFVDINTIPKVGLPNTTMRNQLAALSDLVARLRGAVIRDSHRTIIEVPEPEGTGRLVKALINLATGHAKLFRKTEVDDKDISLAVRTALDSVPGTRLKVFNALGLGSTENDIAKITGLQHSIVEYSLEELRAMDLVVEVKTNNITIYELVDEFAKLRNKALGSNYNVIDFKKKENA